MYNSEVRRWWCDLEGVLPLFDDSEVEDGRLSKNKRLFIPPEVEAKPTKPKKQRRAKAARLIENHLTKLDPKFSIVDGQLRITM